MKLIVGLGNPWKEYEKTRHNIGFWILDTIFSDISWHNKFHWQFAETIFQWQKIFLLKPQTFMNRSGIAVWELANFYKIPASDVLVIHDEIDIPVGKIQYKFGGSPAGHNWLKSIIENIWTPDFARIRVGIDRPTDNKLVADRVLSNFKSDEKLIIEQKISEIESLIQKFLNA